MKKFITILSLALVIAVVQADFNDVSEDHDNFDAINYVQSEGIVNGYKDGTFKPDQKINRAEFTKIVIGAQFSEEEINSCESEKTFSDVPASEWFAPYVCIASNNNIINGYADGTFQPKKNIIFAEAAKIIVKTFDIEIVGAENAQYWYEPYIAILEDLRTTPQSLDAIDKDITRGEMAEIIYRYKEKIKDKPYTQFYSIYDGEIYRSIDNPQTTISDDNVAENEVREVTLDDSDPDNGSGMFDFETGLRTNKDVNVDIMFSGIFFSGTWTRGMDWMVVPMEGDFEDITECPEDGYASVTNVNEEGFGDPINASSGQVYCLKTSDENYALFEVLSAYNEGDDRFLRFKYLFNSDGSRVFVHQ